MNTSSFAFVLAIACCLVALGGCQRSVDVADGEPNILATEDAAAAQQNAFPETELEEEAIAAPETSLTDAAAQGNVELVRQHIAAGTDLDQRDPRSGATALIAAASLGKTKAALLLIESGADLEAKNNQGGTALHTAAFLCREEIVKGLLAKGADRKARNLIGSTALDSVSGPFEEVKPIYDLVQQMLGPVGLELDYEFIKNTRPKIAEILRAE